MDPDPWILTHAASVCVFVSVCEEGESARKRESERARVRASGREREGTRESEKGTSERRDREARARKRASEQRERGKRTDSSSCDTLLLI
jgi:hypothetical protein